MRKIVFAIMMVILMNIGLVFAHEHNLAETKQLIDSGINCGKLTDEQFEAIGDYYMEQMHPGKAHEMMDNMMGGEGSESLKQVHINMARRLYCNDNIYVGYGMMGSGGMIPMMNMMGGGMIGGQIPQTNIMQGMMGNLCYWNFLNVLYIILLIGLIILVYFWILKSWRDFYGKRK